MKLEPMDVKDIPRKTGGGRLGGEYTDAVWRFVSSEIEAAEVDLGGRSPETVQATFCQTLARHRYEFGGIKCIRRQGRIFLVKEAEWQRL